MLRFERISHHSLTSLIKQSNHLKGKYFLQRYFTNNKEIYERKTPIEHVLLRPGMYVGQIAPSSINTWIYDENDQSMKKRNIFYSPALVKIFDEILVNAADNRWRSPEMSYIEIEVNKTDQNLTISITNNGLTVPMDYDEKEKLYVPELIFGHLMTGSNFDDTKNRVTGGMHGYGAKLTNIFSTSFKLEIYDAVQNKKYCQEWNDHMKIVSPPVITSHELGSTSQSHSDSYMKVTFTPDLNLFSTSLTPQDPTVANVDDLLLLLHRRALDLSAVGLFGTSSRREPIEVIFDGELLSINTFSDYMLLFSPTINNDPSLALIGDGEDLQPQTRQIPKIIKLNDHWEIGILPSPTGNFEQMSFVNSVWTSRGGTHVNHIAAQCVRYIQDVLSQMGVESPPTPAKIRNNLMLFVNCLIENPSFDSQGKESLTTKLSQFSSQSEISTKFLKKLFGIKSDLIQLLFEENINRPTLMKATKGKYGNSILVKNLEDAHNAGAGKRRSKCTLIVTEGESAKALAIAGLEVVGRDNYGVLSIQGKIINSVNPRTNVFENNEVVRLCHSLGLDINNDYADGDISSLRYGHLLIMTDQDPDGSHIKGLIINLLNTYWPKLLTCENFIQQLITPLIKVTGVGANTTNQDDKNKKTTISFYSEREYDEWKSQIITTKGPQALKNFTVKYYKGLGTSTSAEGREYFQNLSLHVKNFVFGDQTIDALGLAFSNKRTEDRKVWLQNYSRANPTISTQQKDILYEDFIHKDLINFSSVDLNRSIPSLVDGLKISQRKILYTCLKQNIRKEIKVGQLSGLITDLAAYHNGETSLHNAIVRMAQDYVGSNNIPLLEPCGQFGTRHAGGEDSASPRYIFTRLSPLADLIFPESDLNILKYELEDGKQVEPIFFMPIIPMILVNGCRGIGTGWSTNIPNYNPLDIIDYLLHKIRGEPTSKLLPWVRGFQITELPPYKWTENYKTKLIANLEKYEIKITSLKEYHTVENVKFEIIAPKAELDRLQKSKGGMIKKLSLTSIFSLANMHAFDQNIQLKQYTTPEALVEAYYPVRLEGYHKRKERQLAFMTAEEVKLRNQSNFITDLYSGQIQLTSDGQPIPTAIMNETLRTRGYATQRDIDMITANYQTSTRSSSEQEEYSYLLSLPIRSLTYERAQTLQNRATQTHSELQLLQALAPEEMWISELKILREKLLEYDPTFQKNQSGSMEMNEKEGKKKKKKKVAVVEEGEEGGLTGEV